MRLKKELKQIECKYQQAEKDYEDCLEEKKLQEIDKVRCTASLGSNSERLLNMDKSIKGRQGEITKLLNSLKKYYDDLYRLGIDEDGIEASPKSSI